MQLSSPSRLDPDLFLPLKLAILATAPFSDVVIRGENYNDRYSINDMNVWLDHESDKFIDSDNTYVLEKPTLIIHQTFGSDVAMTEDAMCVAELQVLVNHPGDEAHRGGRPALDGYTQLCKFILDEGGDDLRKGGFVVRRYNLARPRGGEFIDPNLKGRLLMRSLIAYLSYFGG